MSVMGVVMLLLETFGPLFVWLAGTFLLAYALGARERRMGRLVLCAIGLQLTGGFLFLRFLV